MSLIIAPGRVLRCQHCGAHLEVEPDTSREHGYPMLHCPDCTDCAEAGVCGLCGGLGWTVVNQTWGNPYGEQEQCDCTEAVAE